MNAAYDRNAALARSFVDAVNRRDVDDFVAVLAEEVELHTPRGIRRGRREAADWFTKPLDHLELSFRNAHFIVGETEVVGIGDLVFTWKETGEVAERAERAAVWQIDGELIRSWQPFETRAEALVAAGILPESG
jgi:ketosteroid isomerase-like protein